MTSKFLVSLVISTSLIVGCTSEQLKQGMDMLNASSEGGAIGSSEAAMGIKSALTKGAKMAGDQLSKQDGFLKNQAIKILFPPELQKVEKTLRKIGLSSLTDKAVVSFNRAAEKASTKAYPILAKAITNMSFDDAMKILLGKSNEATQYLQKTTTTELQAAFLPIVTKSANDVSATKYWKEMATTYNRIPFVKAIPEDISQYITSKTLQGLFYKVQQEEVEIRKNPMARTNQLLKRVFGYADQQKK